MGRVQPDRPAQEVSMSVSVDPCASPLSGTLSCYVTTAAAVAAAITFSASGAAPTPLYQTYQEHFGLTPFMITIISGSPSLATLSRKRERGLVACGGYRRELGGWFTASAAARTISSR
jgi:hypothetical protein